MDVKKLSRGFTLIELLVVISIIGLLSSVVLASLNSARAKGADAAIKGDLSSVRVQAELYNTTNGAYAASAVSPDVFNGACRQNMTGFGNHIFSDPNIVNAMVDANSKAGGTPIGGGLSLSKTSCAVSQTSYAVAVALKTSTTGSPKSWCVDGSGVAKQINSDFGSVVIGDGSPADPYRCQ